jgi:hypothetical protein
VAAGTHLCSLPATFKEQFAIAVPFLEAGVKAREKCLFICHDNTLKVVKTELERHGLQPSAVTVVPSHATPLRAGSIDAPTLLTAWREATRAAVSEGFTGLRVVVEMTWALAAQVDALSAYEKAAEALFETEPLHALCQYNRTRFPKGVLRRAATSTHPALLLEGGNVSPRPPEAHCAALGWLD